MKKLIVILFLSFICIPAFADEENYGVYYPNRKSLYEICPGTYGTGPLTFYLKHFKSDSKYSGMEFSLKVNSCEDLPENSICIDENTCFIKYRDDK